jgi:ribose transport system permease protein
MTAEANTSDAAPDRDSHTAPAQHRRGGPRLTDIAGRFGLLFAWGIVIITFGVITPDTFLTTTNLQTIFGSQAVLMVATLGLVIALTAGEIDLSIAGVLTLSVVLVAKLNVVEGWPILPAVVVTLSVGLVVGALNAFFVVRMGIESIVATLGMGTLLVGISFAVEDSQLGGISQVLVDATRTQVLGIQIAFYYGLLLTFLVWYVFAFTPLGRYLYFVGAGRDVARLSGIRVQEIRTGALVACSFFAALAGVILAGLLGATDPNAGQSFLLPAFASAFLGATAITPGRFNAWGSFIAVYFLVTGITGLQLLGLSGWIEQVFYGGSLILAVTFSRLLGRREVALQAKLGRLSA